MSELDDLLKSADDALDAHELAKAQVLARRIVFDILHDLRGRSGLRQAWDGVDEEIQAEILQEWQRMATERLR